MESFRSADWWQIKYTEGKSNLPQPNRKKGKMDAGHSLDSEKSKTFPSVILSNFLDLREEIDELKI